MKTNHHNDPCRKMRKSKTGLWAMLKSRVLERLSDHVAHCPRCRQRLAKTNRVEVSLMLIKTQPVNAGLLARANNKALNVLKHSLRNAPKSASLRTAASDVSRFEKMRPGMERVLNVAACVFVVLMIRTGVSHSLLDYKNQGEAVIENYYARNLDGQMFEDIFGDGSV